MKKYRILSVIILGSLSLVGILIFQVFWILNTFKQNENQLDREIISALNEVAHELAEFNQNQSPQINPVIQTSEESFVVNIDDEIHPMILEYYLETSFEKLHYQLDYEYAIYDCESDSMVHLNRINISGKKQKSLEENSFKRISEFNYYFSIRFPGKTAAILFDMNTWYISALIIISALLFFVYAILVMLSQKRFSEVQKDFINNMTHELKTPISTIGISAKVVAEPQIISQPERLKNYADIIVHQNRRMEQQVEKVLQSTLSEKSRIQLELEPVDLIECLKKVSNELSLKIQEKGGDIELLFDADIPDIEAESHHLENLVFNLLDNAIKYSEDPPVILMQVRKEKKKLKLSVKDNGIGMEKEQLKKIFRKFYRIPTGDVHNVKGFGLGLNYVRNIVKAHHWQIKVESEPGKGSTFSIYIPIK